MNIKFGKIIWIACFIMAVLVLSGLVELSLKTALVFAFLAYGKAHSQD